MKFEIFQINLSDAEYDNSSVREMYLDTIMNPTADSVAVARKLYKKVAEIEAQNLNQVFQIGNIGPESKITRLDRMHSVSVGDVIVYGKNAFFVNNLGFDRVAF